MRTNLLKGLRLLSVVLPICLMGCDSRRAVSRSGGSSQAVLVNETGEEAAGQTAPAFEGTGMPEGIARVGGSYFHVRNGKATLLTQRQRFSEGCYFEQGGRVILRDGSAVRLGEHEMVTFSGERLRVPPGVQLPQSRRPAKRYR